MPFACFNCFIIGFDFIIVNGGKRNDNNQYQVGSSLIPLDITEERSSRCSPPGDMINDRKGHILGTTDGNLVACGGFSSSGRLDKCEKFDRQQEDWLQVTDTLEEGKGNFAAVQLDTDRIWMGRKLKNKINKIQCLVDI